MTGGIGAPADGGAITGVGGVGALGETGALTADVDVLDGQGAGSGDSPAAMAT